MPPHRVHSLAYRILAVGVMFIMAASMSLVGHGHLLRALPLPPEQSLFLLYWNLPQSILLWTEPDMEME